jgi:putative MATE family efflux protein
MLVFAIPMLVGNIVQQLYQVIDAMVVGRTLGVDALGAVGATGALTFLVLGFAWGLTGGFAIPTARAAGAGDLAGVRRSVAAGTTLTAITSVVLTVGGPLLAGPALRLMRTPEELLPQATTFAVVTFLGGATMMAFNYVTSVVRAIGDSRTPLVFLVLSCLVNFGLVLLFVAVLRWGVAGAAAATAVSQAIAATACLAYVRKRVPALRMGRNDWRPTRAALAEHVRLGLPMGVQMSIIAIGTLGVQVRLNELGATEVAAYTSAVRVDQLAVVIFQALGMATTTFTAHNLGARRPDRILLGARQAIWMSVAAAVAAGAVLVTVGGHIVALFITTGGDQVVPMAAHYLRVNGSMYVILGVLFVTRGVLQGLGHTFVPTMTATLELVMRIGVAAVLGGIFGFSGVVWANPAAWVAATVLLIVSYVRAHRGLVREVERGAVATPASAPELAPA